MASDIDDLPVLLTTMASARHIKALHERINLAGGKFAAEFGARDMRTLTLALAVAVNSPAVSEYESDLALSLLASISSTYRIEPV
jgi:hypothetical protein